MPSLLGEGDQNDGDQAPAQAAPEAYEPFDVEGQQFTEAQLEGFAATAKELGLSQENAQKMLAAMVPTARQYLVDDLKAKSREWASLSEKDPEIGGANFKANVGVANSALKQFDSRIYGAFERIRPWGAPRGGPCVLSHRQGHAAGSWCDGKRFRPGGRSTPLPEVQHGG